MRAAITISEIRSREGDHKTALDDLRVIRPTIEFLGKHEPLYLFQYANEVAFELLQVHRLDEARRFAQFALSSPFAFAYPEWQETALEVEQQTAKRNAVAVPPEPEQQKRPAQPKYLLVVLRFSQPVRVARPLAFRQRVTCDNPTVALVVLVARIRAPSIHPT